MCVCVKPSQQTHAKPSGSAVKIKPAAAKDTVFVTCPVPGRPRHVEQHQLGLRGLFEDDLIEFECRVHAPHVELVPGGGRQTRGGGAAFKRPQESTTTKI